MKNTRKVGSTTLTVCLLAVAASCGSDAATAPEGAPVVAATTVGEADEVPATTETPDTTSPTTRAPETTEPELVEPPATAAASASTTQPVPDTIVVPYHTFDAGFPAGATCDDAIRGFDVAFTNESGERNIVEARFANSSSAATEDTNAACAIELFDGAPVLLMTAQLVVPAAKMYQLIETRYPYADGVGNDTYTPEFEMVTSEEAQAGLYVGVDALDPSEVVDLAFPIVE